jgi:prolyl-tRNA editing enzyme YbaK/EbsC (Cys-tRNA(Pro) deacylase)
MSFASDKRKLHDESLPLNIRASHARSCALHVAQKLGFNREKVIKTVYLETGVDLINPAKAGDLLVAFKCLETLRQQR